MLILVDLELLGDVLAEHGGWSLDLELDLLEPLDLGLVKNLGQVTFGFLLEFPHRLAHDLEALGLHGVGRLLSLELGRLLLHGGIDLAPLDPPAVDLGLITPVVQGPGQGIAGSRAASIDGGINLPFLQRLGLCLLGRLRLGHVGLLAKLLEYLAPLLVLVVGDLLDLRFLAIGQLELFRHGVVAGQRDQVAAGAAGSTPVPAVQVRRPVRHRAGRVRLLDRREAVVPAS